MLRPWQRMHSNLEKSGPCLLVFAVHHLCADFVKSAAAAEHPRHLYAGVPDVLATCVKRCATMSYEDTWQRMRDNLEKVDLACSGTSCTGEP